MRGGADTDEKMGHEQEASPNPRAMCCNFQLGAQHQLLGMCASTVANMVEQRGTRSFTNKRQTTAGTQALILTISHDACSYSSVLKLEIGED